MPFSKKAQGNDWPQTPHNSIVDEDPMIVRVPLDNVEWGSRKSTMAKARGADGFSDRKLDIKHVDGKK